MKFICFMFEDLDIVQIAQYLTTPDDPQPRKCKRARVQASGSPDFELESLGDDIHPNDQQNFDGGKLGSVDLRDRSVNKAKTGTWKAAPFLYALTTADFQASVSASINLVPYLAITLHQPISKAATITTNFAGTGFLLTVLGGFVADSYLGAFGTIAGGAVAMCLGLGLLTFTTAYSRLQPAFCEKGPTTSCRPAEARYMAPLYLALYTIALGTGLVKPSSAALGANQFDDSSAKEKKQSVHFFVWFYFFANVGLFIAFSLGVYLQDHVSRSWGYGFALMFYAACFLIFILGASTLRHKPPAGSFLTRIAQVFVAAVFKRNAPIIPLDTDNLYDPVQPGGVKLAHTNTLRFLDRAAVVRKVDAAASREKSHNPWRVCSISQVEESKRILQMIPIWAAIAPVSLVFSQMITFTVQQGRTFDRRLGPDFEVPSASLNVMLVLSSLVTVPTYDMILVPFVRKFTKHPYGFTTLQRLGASIIFAMLTMITAALVERKRLTYVRELHLEALSLGAYILPLKMWWLLPQYFLSSLVELFMFVSSYQFFYYEASEGTRSIGSSFTYSASAMGYYFSTVLVELVNRTTRNSQGGSWLEEKLNNGGLENFYWLLTVLLAVNFLVYLGCSHWYQYKYDWYHHESSPQAISISHVTMSNE